MRPEEMVPDQRLLTIETPVSARALQRIVRAVEGRYPRTEVWIVGGAKVPGTIELFARSNGDKILYPAPRGQG